MIYEMFKKLENVFIEKFVKTSTENRKIYEDEGVVNIISPGRVNIIGEHTDYNFGYSMPIAINKYKFFTGMKNKKNVVEIYDNGFNEYYEFPINNIIYDKETVWSNYIKGVFKEYIDSGNQISGISFVIDSNLVSGSGISSSAALLCGTAQLLEILFGLNNKKRDIMEFCHRAENNFVMIDNGYLDHFSVIYGKKDNATFLNFKDLSYSYVPLNLKNHIFLIIDSREERYLPATDYNKRRQECITALSKIVEVTGEKNILSLSDVSIDMLQSVKEKIPEVLFKRARHVITENKRVFLAKKFLENDDFFSLGKTIYDSHRSLSDDYDVSTEKLNFLVEHSMNINSIFGARLMGAGFGGCTIALTEKSSVNNVIDEISAIYEKKFRLKPNFVECISSDGTKEIVNIFKKRTENLYKKVITKDDGRYLIYYDF